MNAVVILLLILAVVLMGLVLTKRLIFPLMMEFGMSLVSIGLVFAAEALHSDTSCSPAVLAVRWGLVGCGLLLILVSVARKRAKGLKRLSDYTGVRPEDMKHITGGKQ